MLILILINTVAFIGCKNTKESMKVIEISAGNRYTLALKEDGTVVAWEVMTMVNVMYLQNQAIQRVTLMFFSIV